MQSVKLIVAGSRDYLNREFIYKYLQQLSKKYKLTIVSGMAPGPDTFGYDFAIENNLDILEFKANWDDLSEPCVLRVNRYGKEYNAISGHNRNQKMADVGDALLLFWDMKSNGSKDMLRRAKKSNLKIKVVDISKDKQINY